MKNLLEQSILDKILKIDGKSTSLALKFSK